MGSSPQSGTNENGRWEGPLQRRCPNDPNRTSVEDQLKIAELRLDKKKKKLPFKFDSQRIEKLSHMIPFIISFTG